MHSLYETKDIPNPEHGIAPGDWVWVKIHRAQTLEGKWKRPYVVILATPTALKVDGIGPWVHHSHVSRATLIQQEEAENWTVQRDPDNLLRLQLSRSQRCDNPATQPNDGMAAYLESAHYLVQGPH